MPAVSSFVDTFDGPSLHAEWITVFNSAAQTVNGQLTIDCTSSYSDVATDDDFDLTDDAWTLEVISIPAVGNGSTEVYCGLASTVAGTKLEFLWTNGTMSMVANTGSGDSSTTLSGYNTTDDRWLRLEHDSGAGEVYFQSSSDGETWTTHRTVAMTTGLTTFEHYIGTGYWGTESSPGSLVVDNQNNPPVTTPTATGDAATHAHSATQPTIQHTPTVGIDGSTHSLATDSPTVTAQTDIPTDGAQHAHTATGPSVEAIPLTDPQNAAHGHSATSPAISEAGLATGDDAGHPHSATEPTITALYPISPADAAHGHSASAPSIVAFTPATVVVGDTLHAHSVGSPLVSDDTIRFTPPRVPVDRTATKKNYRSRAQAAYGGLWMKLTPVDHGQNVWLDSDGVWHSGAGTMAELEAAQVYYLGGRTYVLTEAEATALEDAGYEVDR